MREVIRGDTEPVHIVVASKAIDKHRLRYGTGNKYHHVVYSIGYRDRHYQIEVVTRKTTISATVITGCRNLSRVHHEQ
ncbi:DUF4060 family protein [Rosenbergiella nectarea]|uniref:DUF4060 family protein n=1 Tax=Rosenbergiella nectarea TaxID=988801 RepID=UPI001F4EB212